jgi:predicted NBD/HSP70 family sugar kinase/biotin operon repressor
VKGTAAATPFEGLPAEAHSSNDFIRRRNLSALINLLHHRGPHSRSDLTQQLGLTRSTIAVLVAELVESGLALEVSQNATGRVGRPSSVVAANPHVAAIAVHPEPDAITVGLVGLGGEVLARLRHDVSGAIPAKKMVGTISSLVDGMRADIDRHYEVIGVGLAIPGLVSAHDGKVLIAPHLKWKNEPIARELSARLGYRVTAGNDSSIGAMAEFLFGAGQGMHDIVFANGTSSGIGGGIVIAGQLLKGKEGYAGELGHTLVNTNGRRCYCGRRGCLEAEVNMSLLLPLLGRTRIDEDELDIELGVARDPAVMREVARQVELLSEALTNFVNLFNPEMVVLSGYLGALLSVSRERLVDAVRVRPLGAEGRTVRLERARLRSRLMLVGAAELAFGDVLGDPAGRAAQPFSAGEVPRRG